MKNTGPRRLEAITKDLGVVFRQVIGCTIFMCFLTSKMASKTISGMCSMIAMLGLLDAIPGIVFLHHVWRQKTSELFTHNHLLNSGKRVFDCLGKIFKSICLHFKI